MILLAGGAPTGLAIRHLGLIIETAGIGMKCAAARIGMLGIPLVEIAVVGRVAQELMLTASCARGA